MYYVYEEKGHEILGWGFPTELGLRSFFFGGGVGGVGCHRMDGGEVTSRRQDRTIMDGDGSRAICMDWKKEIYYYWAPWASAVGAAGGIK